LFVLSDGETNQGLLFDNLKPLIEAIGIPIYTIGYEADLDELKRLSSLVEASSMSADQDDIAHKVGTVLAVLDSIEDRRYTEFSLTTGKKRVHGWQTSLRRGDLVA
jgi:hypothetical protein